ncbi:MAG: NADH-quinone oxidoreductase subunit NuoK [Candidatus Magnetobacterium sp. LHC-1]|uniref:NADH-quinone oxidoreductase subunit K n=1 Tax=Candidatus Magnetobacterium casense TaxID=1455061 RepID=A0ABS6RV84_9BACT|nr:NADH-quinone oxidoreductase subunit NuoK [Candidatus Magnetobacterium casensis]MBF0606143.1 NADH-quinone oxidoreductase subunit NuoK [Nitrospirota bacterium]MBV6340496.1 NADH-quinone oxidoreductase subunit NuoK [Candidatus Magnetobacterium casensis]
MVPLNWYIWLSGVMFCIGMFGYLARRNIIIMLLSVEIMFNSVNISLVAFSHYLEDLTGQIMVFMVIAVAAAEAAIGLALVILLYRNYETISVDEVSEMKG